MDTAVCPSVMQTKVKWIVQFSYSTYLIFILIFLAIIELLKSMFHNEEREIWSCSIETVNEIIYSFSYSRLFIKASIHFYTLPDNK